jgi:acetyl-CoA carboxylase biotin carboxyl carrier protein
MLKCLATSTVNGHDAHAPGASFPLRGPSNPARHALPQATTVTDFGITPEQLKRLARLVEEANLAELRYEEGDFAVTVRTAAHQPAPALPFAPVLPVVLPGQHTAETGATDFMRPPTEDSATATPDQPEEDDSRFARVEAPLMGVFYRSASPDDPPFIEVGDTVDLDQTIGLIEAMKVFSEIKAEVSGRVRDLPVATGTLVQPGQTLVVLEPAE